jgi:hypothetical protein
MDSLPSRSESDEIAGDSSTAGGNAKFEVSMHRLKRLLTGVMFRGVHPISGTQGISPFFIAPDLSRDDEIRLNRAIYDHIRNNYLYSAEGLKPPIKRLLRVATRT